MANRREFLKGIATVGAASGLGATSGSATSEDFTKPGTQARQKVSAVPPSSREEVMEGERPDDYSETEAEHYFVKRPGSDFMVDVVKSLGTTILPRTRARASEGSTSRSSTTVAIANPSS